MCELQGPLWLLPDPNILVLEDGTCGSSTSVPASGDAAESSGWIIVFRYFILSKNKVVLCGWCRRRSDKLIGVSL